MSLSPRTLHRLHRPLQDSTESFLEALVQEVSGLCEQDTAIDPLEVSDLFLKQLKSKLKGWKISNWDFLSRKAGTLEIDLQADSPDGKIKKHPHAGIEVSDGKFSATYTLGRKDKSYSAKGASLKDLIGKIVSGLGSALSGVKEAVEQDDPIASLLSEVLSFCTEEGIELRAESLDELVSELESWISYPPLSEARSSALKSFVERLKKMIFTMLNKSKKTISSDDEDEEDEEGELPGDAGDAGDDGEDDEEVDEAQAPKGEKITIYHVHPMGGLVKTEGFLNSLNKHIVNFVPKRGRVERAIMSAYDSFWMVVKGWGHPAPDNPQRIISKSDGAIVSKPKYGGVKGTIRHAEDFMATIGKDLKSKTMAIYQNGSLKTFGDVPMVKQEEDVELRTLISDLRSLTEQKKAAKKKSMKLGGGGRFAKLKAALAKRGDISDPGALAAWIGRKKYGKKKFQKMAAKGRKRG